MKGIMISGIYRIYSIATGESYYGSSNNLKRRFIEHKFKWRRNKGNYKIRQLLKEYGIHNFNFEILEYCLPEKFEEREKWYISNDLKCLNVWVNPFSSKDCLLGKCVKGKKFYGTKHSNETKEKLKESMQKYYENNEGHWKDKTIPDDIKHKISNGLKKYFKNNPHPNKGKTLSEETRKKISETLKKRNENVRV